MTDPAKAAPADPRRGELVTVVREIIAEAEWATAAYPTAGFPSPEQVRARFAELFRKRGLGETLALARGCRARLLFPCAFELPPAEGAP